MPTLSSRLNDVTRKMLRERPRYMTLKRIEAETGLPVNWLSAFQGSAIRDPSCARIETLYEYLTKTKLEIIQLTA